MFGSRVEVGDVHLHCLDLLMFGGDGADFVAHRIALHWHILALNVRDVHKDVVAPIGWRDEAMAF